MAAILQPGTTLDGGKYRIIRLLGSGGMGSVYEAENLRARKRVAIKGLHPKHSRAEGGPARVTREAHAACRVPHPNVVDVYDVIADGDQLYLVMEYLVGETLRSFLRTAKLEPQQMLALLLPAMKGVAAAHKQGVIHRDLKPDNIFLAKEGENETPTPKVLDFGISKLEVSDAALPTLTTSGHHIMGTPAYMSLEQLQGATVDARADVYAVGVILYEALTGQLPYQAPTWPELIYKITSGTVQPPQAIRPDLARVLDRLVMYALARDAKARVSSMDGLIRELEPLSTDFGYRAARAAERDDGDDCELEAELSRPSLVPPSRPVVPVRPQPVAAKPSGLTSVPPSTTAHWPRRAWIGGAAILAIASGALWFTLGSIRGDTAGAAPGARSPGTLQVAAAQPPASEPEARPAEPSVQQAPPDPEPSSIAQPNVARPALPEPTAPSARVAPAVAKHRPTRKRKTEPALAAAKADPPPTAPAVLATPEPPSTRDRGIRKPRDEDF